MRLFRSFTLAAAVLAAAVFPTAANAAPITWTFSGEITTAESPNPAGLAAGDPITGFATFESTDVAPVGAFYLPLDGSPGAQLSFTVGAFTFSLMDDLNYGFGYPLLVFMNAQLVGFEFLALLPAPLDHLAFDVVGTSVLVTDEDDGFRQVAAGRITTFTAPAPGTVPEPALLPLFALGAAWIGRRAARGRLA